MFSGQTRNLPYIRKYSEAKAWWDTHPKPPRSKRWEDYQRPLRNTASKHYRLESMNPDEYIDVVLYHTVMARYYKPTPDGKERRLYIGNDTNTSKSFMWDVLYINPYRNTEKIADDKEVSAPVYQRHFMSDGGDSFSADFTFDANDFLIPEESRHTRHWRKVSNEDDKAARAHIREMFSVYLDLAMLKLSEFEANVDLEDRAGRPFGTKDSWLDNQGVHSMYQAMLRGDLPEQNDIERFFEVARSVFDTIASKRAYDQDDFVLENYWTKHQGKTASPYADLKKPVTGDELRKALEAKIMRICGADIKSGRQEIPQFVAVNDYPRSNVLVGENP